MADPSGTSLGYRVVMAVGTAVMMFVMVYLAYYHPEAFMVAVAVMGGMASWEVMGDG